MWAEAVAVVVCLYHWFEPLQTVWFVSIAVFVFTLLAVLIVPQLAYIWLKPIVTYEAVKHDHNARPLFFYMALFVVPIITVLIYLFSFRQYKGIEHWPLFAQASVWYSLIQLFITVYKFVGRILLRLAKVCSKQPRLTALIRPRPRPRPRPTYDPPALELTATAPRLTAFSMVNPLSPPPPLLLRRHQDHSGSIEEL